MKLRLNAFTALAAVAVLSGALARAQEPDDILMAAVSRFNEGNYAQAASTLGTLTTAQPGNDAAWYYLGMSEAGLGHLDKAAESLSRAVQLDSGNFWYRQRLASVYQAQGEDDMVVGMYESIVADFPKKTEVWFDLLTLYLKQGRFEKALEALGEVELVTGPTEQTARTRYDIYRTLGRESEGIQSLLDFSDRFSSPSVLSMLGDYYLSEYQDSLSLVYYNEALEAESDYIPALLGKAEVYRTTRRYPEYFDTMGRFMDNPDAIPGAKSMYLGNLTRSVDPKILRLHAGEYDDLVERMTAVHPADSSILSAAGTYYYATGRTDKAGACFGEAARLYPESLNLSATYVQFLGILEDWPSLKEFTTSAFDRIGDPAFLEYAQIADYNLGNYDEVIAGARRLLSLYPGDKDRAKSAYSMMGDMYHLKGELKSAYKMYDRALKIDPGYAPVLNNYAYYLSLEGKKLGKAYTMSRKTVDAEPDNSTYLDTFAWILHLQGKDTEAKPFFKRAMLYGGKESAVILDHYAEVLYSLGEYDLAKMYWSQAKQKNLSGDVPDLDSRVAKRLESLEKK